MNNKTRKPKTNRQPKPNTRAAMLAALHPSFVAFLDNEEKKYMKYNELAGVARMDEEYALAKDYTAKADMAWNTRQNALRGNYQEVIMAYLWCVRNGYDVPPREEVQFAN